MIIEGTTEKLSQFIVQLGSINNKKPWFHWTKNVFLNTTERFKQEKVYQLTLFCHDFFSNRLFRAALCRLMLVLHKDVLLYCAHVSRSMRLSECRTFMYPNQEMSSYVMARYKRSSLFSKKRFDISTILIMTLLLITLLITSILLTLNTGDITYNDITNNIKKCNIKYIFLSAVISKFSYK
jgi:hypothetical protein